jgi:glycosyltransferase involved in cell wall biosynthesis/GT2 family glycosyltransferase
MPGDSTTSLDPWNRLARLGVGLLTSWSRLASGRKRRDRAGSATDRSRQPDPSTAHLQVCRPARRTGADPTIAVVICTRDRIRALLETLDSIWAQTRRPEELIIIDDGCLPDRVLEQVADRCREVGIAWRHRHTDSPGLTRGRNLAAQIAESEVLQYLDDDVTCEPGFLAEIDRIMGDPDITAVTATVREPAFSSLSARCYQLGYRLAGWWRVRPRGRPAGPRPEVLRHPEEAAPAPWLSGAAMAIRRDVVRTWRFDEQLTDYALGEDREFGYRLAPRHWLVEARKALVVHRREAARRTDSRRLGFMTSYNYLRILRQTCRLGVGDWLLIGWGLTTLAALHALWMVLGDRRTHLEELRGMVKGVLAFARQQSAPVGAGTGASPAEPRGSIRTRPLPVRTGTASRPSSRVLFVTTTLDPGGAELMLSSLLKHLPRSRVLPFVSCLKDEGPLAEECRASGTPVFANALRFRTDVAVIQRLHRIIQDNRIDVVVAAHSGGDRMFWATLAAKTMGLPVVVWSHWFPTPTDRHFEPANRALMQCVDAFVALGEAHRLALIRHAHAPAGRIAIIPNAIEVQRFAAGPSRAEARRRLGLADGDVAVAIIANLRSEKRHDVFIQAARKLAAANASYRFLIIGDGPNHHAVWASASASGLVPDRLRLLGHRDDVHELLPGLDICCLCSEAECFSVIMLEAAAAGCPFIGPDTGSLGEHLKHRWTGLVIKPADVASLADAVSELAADPALRRQVVEGARESVVRYFGIEQAARSFADLFSTL